ncbi:hypothetical protein QNO07_07165 [Streptomyces sp. 549]|uniref:hypothetical protein n=1 Tax=Streptomyces sp. 549 TaxID=3049076 RepID=UPI0024C3B842|nr:hypothetical protein [Streptomyces sp. 549]MDK1473203.1 hypothetical protein [Streptomyces sp. 549]
MIARGARAEAELAARALRDALEAADVHLPALAVDVSVWDGSAGPVRLVELGSVPPEVALRLAAAVRRGADRRAVAAPPGRRPADGPQSEGADLPPGSMAFPPCACHRCRPGPSSGEASPTGRTPRGLSAALRDVNRRSTRGRP